MSRKFTHAGHENSYMVLNARVVELRIAYRKEIVRVLIDKADYGSIRSYHWVCRAHRKHGINVVMMGENGIGQSLQSFIFDGRPRSFVKIPKDKQGRLDYRKKRLLRFARDNCYFDVNEHEVELRIYYRHKHIRVLIDKEDQPKVSQYTWHCAKKAGLLRIENIARKNSPGPKTNSLHNVILGKRRAQISENPKDEKGRLDYRKKSLLAEQKTYVNTYRHLNKKEMELHIVRKGKTFRVRFDREDYSRIKEHTWRIWAAAKNPGVFCFDTGVPLTSVILERNSMRIPKIPVERKGRLDYRKKSLLKGFWSNEYRKLNEKEVELHIARQDRAFCVLFDLEDLERVKEHRWRVRNTRGKITIVGCQNSAALAKVILQDPSARISTVYPDSRGRLDYRKQNLLSVTASCSNRYRILNEKEVELLISRQGKEFCILFDRRDYRRIKARHWICRFTPEGTTVACAKTRTALTKVILKDPSARVWKINRDAQGRLDYRKASLLAEIGAYSNEYRKLNKKEVELQIIKPGKELRVRVLFDREDYDRLKTRHWRCRSDGGIICAETKAPLAKVVLENPSVRISKIPRDAQGRLDYRKASLSARIAAFSNEYRVLNEKEVELQIVKPGTEIRILFDREDYDRVKAFRWRCKSKSNRVWINCVQTGEPLTQVILKDPSVRINKIPKDNQDRWDYRKKKLVS